MTKTCGECKYFNKNYSACSANKRTLISRRPNRDACEMFEPQVITNGDKIITGGMRAIAELSFRNKCSMCIYSTYEEDVVFGEAGWTCNCPKDKSCADGIEAWLNAPAESEGANGQ